MVLNRSLLNNIKHLRRIGMNLRSIYNSAKKVLVFAPHADDEIISCAGSLIWHATQLHSIFCCYVTNETNDMNVKIRRQESHEVMRNLNAQEIHLQAYELDLCVTDEMVSRIVKLIWDIKPDIIYCPSPWETHPDHYKTYELLYKASYHLLKYMLHYDCDICFYEIWDNSMINAYFIITDNWDKKVQLLNLYSSQHEHHIVQLAKLMNQLSALRFLHQDNQFVESFYLCKLSKIIEFHNIAQYFIEGK